MHFSLPLTAIAFCASLLTAGTAAAHCDTVDGPVVLAAKAAIEARDVRLVAIWVEQTREAEIRDAFRRALAVRVLSTDARDLADTWFFETLVRVHREGEGEPYTGLKPAGTPVEPAIAAADRAMATGSLAPLEPFLPPGTRAEFQTALARVLAAKGHRPDDVEAGRAWVHAYVEFLHKLEHQEAPPAPAGAGPEGALKVPPALAAEHAELHDRLAEAVAAGGETAKAARALVEVLHPHFVREEQIATPPLRLLPALAEGRASPDMEPALAMTQALRAELPRMLDEHVAIKSATRALGDAARREGHLRIERFSARLLLHAETEEQVLYPAALLVGRVLESRPAK